MYIQEEGVLGIKVPEKKGEKPSSDKENVTDMDKLIDGEEERGDEFLPPLFVD